MSPPPVSLELREWLEAPETIRALTRVLDDHEYVVELEIRDGKRSMTEQAAALLLGRLSNQFPSAPSPPVGELDARVREALEFYADEGNYNEDDAPGECVGAATDPETGAFEAEWDPDRGGCARAALALLDSQPSREGDGDAREALAAWLWQRYAGTHVARDKTSGTWQAESERQPWIDDADALLVAVPLAASPSQDTGGGETVSDDRPAYVVTSSRRGSVLSTRSVSELNDAKHEARMTIFEHSTGENPGEILIGQINALSETGGTVGPLPDGTVITVERPLPESSDAVVRDSLLLLAAAGPAAEILPAEDANGDDPLDALFARGLLRMRPAPGDATLFVAELTDIGRDFLRVQLAGLAPSAPSPTGDRDREVLGLLGELEVQVRMLASCESPDGSQRELSPSRRDEVYNAATAGIERARDLLGVEGFAAPPTGDRERESLLMVEGAARSVDDLLKPTGLHGFALAGIGLADPAIAALTALRRRLDDLNRVRAESSPSPTGGEAADAGERWVCPSCDKEMPGPEQLCSGAFTDADHPSNVRPVRAKEAS